jgi:hypothetical protein
LDYPLDDTLFSAGEATDSRQMGTVAGAIASGYRGGWGGVASKSEESALRRRRRSQAQLPPCFPRRCLLLATFGVGRHEHSMCFGASHQGVPLLLRRQFYGGGVRPPSRHPKERPETKSST